MLGNRYGFCMANAQLKPGMHRTTIEYPAADHERLKAIAGAQRRSVNAQTAVALSEWLAEHHDDGSQRS